MDQKCENGRGTYPGDRVDLLVVAMCAPQPQISMAERMTILTSYLTENLKLRLKFVLCGQMGSFPEVPPTGCSITDFNCPKVKHKHWKLNWILNM